MTRQELAKYDGREGRRAYAAVSGKIYDFTDSPLWSGGNHQQAHQAGYDLTDELLTAPHVRAVVERFPVVGELEESPIPNQAGSRLWLGLATLILLIALLWLLLR